MYKVVVNTDAYKHMHCSKKNWEPGTINDFMVAINGWSIIEPDLKCLQWRIESFFHHAHSQYEPKTKFKKWRERAINKIRFFDRLCDMHRIEDVGVYGFAQGYIDVDSIIGEVKNTGKAKIDFSRAYDLRQRLGKIMKGCYLEITDMGAKNG